MNILDQIRYSPVDEPGTGMRGHLALLHCLAAGQCMKGKIVELGTGRGRSTNALWSGVVSLRGMCSVDSNPETENNCPRHESFRFIVSDTVAAADLFSPCSVSLLFVDSRHYRDHTLAELNAWSPKMIVDGVICGHDTDNPCDPGYDVLGAVAEFLALPEQSCKWDLQLFAHDYGFFILWPARDW